VHGKTCRQQFFTIQRQQQARAVLGASDYLPVSIRFGRIMIERRTF
jgi:hypothetical protein